MKERHYPLFFKKQQYIVGVFSVVLVSTGCYLLLPFIGYKVVALILLFTVSVNAMFFDMLPVILVAFLSAVIWDYFFIPPKFTLFISKAEDVLMFLSYFIIAMVNTVLTNKNRQWQEIARKKEEQQTALQLYGTLLNSLSHELRTPIATIIGAVDNLTDATKLSEKDKEELLGEVSKAALRLNGQVENLLNISRLESGVIKPLKDWCDIEELIYHVKNQLKEYAGNHVMHIKVHENMPLCNIDAGLISQALYNLIYNALLYTPENTMITISAALNNNALQLIVEDEGGGFPEDEIEKVFEKFYRINNTRTGGTGLGLSIVKGFVEAHNGTILLKNKDSGGAFFMISIRVETSHINNIRHE